MSRHPFPILFGLALLASFGCDDKKPSFPGETRTERVALGGARAPMGDMDGRQGPKGPGVAVAEAPAQPNAVAAADPTVERKVILNVQMELIVENVEEAGQKIIDVVRSSKGYVIKSDESVIAGSRRQAVWTLRVPAKSVDGVTDSLRQLGEVTRRNMDSKDVTDEYYDTEVRVKHWKAEEETLMKLMKEKAEKPDDILKFRAQITPIRENIERMEARMKTIRTLTEMSTIDLTLRDRDIQTPANTSGKPATSVGRTFAASVETLQNFGHDVLIAVVGLAPWLPLILVAVLLLRWFVRRLNPPKPRREPPPLTPRPTADESTADAS